MEPWIGEIGQQAHDNENFRTVLFTAHHEQLVVMRLRPGEDIGYEVHHHTDQFLRIEQGRARVELGPKQDEVEGRRREGRRALGEPALGPRGGTLTQGEQLGRRSTRQRPARR